MSDLISRQAAIKAIRKDLHADKDYMSAIICEGIENVLNNLPSAEPERKNGKWMPFDKPWYQCSECGAVRENNSFMENFCPNCGADMRGGEYALN